MADRVLDFEAGYQRRRAEMLERATKDRARARPMPDEGDATGPACQLRADQGPPGLERAAIGDRTTALNYTSLAEGAAAGWAGDPCSTNPYAIESEEGMRWHAGWMDARVALRMVAFMREDVSSNPFRE